MNPLYLNTLEPLAVVIFIIFCLNQQAKKDLNQSIWKPVLAHSLPPLAFLIGAILIYSVAMESSYLSKDEEKLEMLQKFYAENPERKNDPWALIFEEALLIDIKGRKHLDEGLKELLISGASVLFVFAVFWHGALVFQSKKKP